MFCFDREAAFDTHKKGIANQKEQLIKALLKAKNCTLEANRNTVRDKAELWF